MALISVVTPCYNEEGNVAELAERLAREFDKHPQHEFEHLFIDNASKDGTVRAIKALIAADPRVRLIVNARNFGHIRSPYHGVLQASGDAIIGMASDLQDPPEMLSDLIAAWERGYMIVKAVRSGTEETLAMRMVRGTFYWLIARISDLELTKNYTGTGLYDRRVIDVMREIRDPYPYFRGLVSEIGFEHTEVVFHQARRKRGISANNFYTLYDMAMLGITKHSRVPLRLMTFAGFTSATLSFLVGVGFLLYKLTHWYEFQVGQAPLLLGVFFSFSMQMMFMGILGEYVGNIFTHVQGLPHVVEKERVNMPPQARPREATPASRAPDTARGS